MASGTAAAAATFTKNTVDTVVDRSLHNTGANFRVNFLRVAIVRFVNN